MMNRKIEPAPYAGELQIAVDKLATILAPVDLVLQHVTTARANRRAADAERDEAQKTYAEVCHRFGSSIVAAQRMGHGQPAEVQAARRSLEQAEARRSETRKAFSRAREKQDSAFFDAIMPQINEA